MGAISAVAFALSILLHEFGHALEARREGMTIHSITLWLFGGVARFEGFFPSGAAEIRVALAGPAVSLVLGPRPVRRIQPDQPAARHPDRRSGGWR